MYSPQWCPDFPKTFLYLFAEKLTRSTPTCSKVKCATTPAANNMGTFK